MAHYKFKSAVFGILAVLIFFLSCQAISAVTPQQIKVLTGPKNAENMNPDQAIPLSDQLVVYEINSIVAQLSDAQVRRLLIDELRKEASHEAALETDKEEVGGLGSFIQDMKTKSALIREQIRFLRSGIN